MSAEAAAVGFPNAARDAGIPGRPHRPPVRPRIGTAALFLVNGIGIGAWAGALPVLRITLGLSNQGLSLVLAAFAAGAVLSMMFAARLAARFDASRAGAVAALAFALALALPPLATTLPTLILSGALLGLCNGVLDVCMNTHATTVERAWGKAIMSSFHAVFSLGGMIGAAGLSALLRGGLTLTGGMAAAAGLTVVLGGFAIAVGLRLGLSPTEPVEPSTSWRFPDRRILIVAALAFLAMLIEGAMADWSGVFMTEVVGVPAAIAATAYAAFSVAMLVGRLLGDGIVHRLGTARVLRYGALTVGVAIVVAVAAPLPDVARLCFALSGIGLSNLVPVLFSASSQVAPERPQDGVAGAAMGGYAGFLLGPLIIGLGAQAVGLRLALLLLMAATAILATTGPRLLRRA